MNIELFLKCRPTGQIRESNLRVKISGLAGQGDPTRMKPVSRGSIGRWRVGSGRVWSGQQCFKSRGSDRVESRGFQNLAGRVGSSQRTYFFSRVGSGQLTRPMRFDLPHEKPSNFSPTAQTIMRSKRLFRMTELARISHTRHFQP